MASFTSLSAGDGNVFVDNGTTWGTTHDRPNGDNTITNGTVANIYGAMFGANAYGVGRVFLPFNTSTLTGTAGIANGTLSFTAVSVTGVAATVHLVQTTQAAANGLVVSDFQKIGNVSGGSVAITAAGDYNLVLNSTGLGWINNVGTTFIGLREQNDLTNTTPVLDHRWSIVMADNASNKPTLNVTTQPIVPGPSNMASVISSLFFNQ